MVWVGRHVYGLSAIALGAVGLAWGEFAAVWQPFPDGVPARQVIAYALAGVFLVSGLLLQLKRTAAIGALICAALGVMFAGLWVGMRVVNSPATFGLYNGVAEQMAIALGGVAAFVSVHEAAWAPRLVLVARILFGVCCLVFGGAHFVYVTETAAMTPAYMAGGTTLWAQITGACHAAAGLALISGVFATIAARLLTLMFVGFGVLVWGPMLFTASGEHMTWAGNAINLSLVGAAWMIADMVADARKA